MEIITLTVKGMTCTGCARSVKNVLEPMPGVSGVDIALETGQVAVGYDPAVADADQFKAAIRDAGYEVID